MAAKAQPEPPATQLAPRPDLNPKLSALVEKAKQEKSGEVFFSWLEGDTALVQVTGRKVIPTKVGKSPLYSAVYLQGNIHGRPGAPEASGNAFAFYAQTVLESAFERMGIVTHGDDPSLDEKAARDGKVLAETNVVLVVSCLGEKEGKRYYDFVVKRLSDDDLALGDGED